MDATVAPAPPRHAIPAEVRSRAEAYFLASESGNTRRAYAADWRHFQTWCAAASVPSLPAAPETLVHYLTALADLARPGTLTRRLSAISRVHQLSGRESPVDHPAVRKLMAGIRRIKGTAQVGKRPVVTQNLRAMVEGLGRERPVDVRDRALLLLGFAGAFRRSELVALNFEDVESTRDGLIIVLRASKTDPEGQGRRVGIPYGSTPATCPVRAFQAWAEILGASAGSLFRRVDRHGRILGRLTPQSVAIIVKRRAAEAGLPPGEYAGHSLRAGFATAAAAAGVSERAIMAQTGHRSVMTLRRYIREGSLFLENAAAKVGL